MYVAPKPHGRGSLPQNQFKFGITEEGPFYSVPKLQFVKPAIVAQMSGKEAGAALFMLLTEYAPGALEQLEDIDQVTGIYQAWASESGVSVGESSGSGDSSVSTAEPSTGTYSSSAEASTNSRPEI